MRKKVIFSLLLLSRLIFSQDITGNLTGQVVDSLGAAVSGMNVSVAGSILQGVRGAVSDSYGYFVIHNLPVGLLNVTISSINYRLITFENISIQLGTTTSIGVINLHPRSISIPEVIVSDKKTIFDPTSTTAGGKLENNTFDALPTDRNFRNMLAIIPQVSESYFAGDEANIAGSTGPENIYFIDGVNTSANLPYNFVREVQVKSGGYEAEYGYALGGIVNVLTQSGSNDFHGQFFSFFTNNVLGGERRPGLEVVKIPGFESYDLGFSLGGPILRNKIWYFAAYNPTVDIVNIQLPGFGNYSDKKFSHLFAGKLNLQPDLNTSLVFSIFGDPNTRHAIVSGAVENGWTILNQDPLFYQINKVGYNISINGWHMFNEHLLFESCVSYLHYIDETYPGGRFESSFQDDISNTLSGGVGEKDKNISTSSSAKASLTLLLPGHSIKAGIQFEDNSYKSNKINNPSGSIIERNRDSSYSAYYFYSDLGTIRNRTPSAFIQDSWTVSERFSLNPGFRWDAQFLISSDGKLWQTIKDEYQPRIGIIFQPGQIGTQKVFASYGRFYELIPLILAHVYGSISPLVEIDYNHNPLLDNSGGQTYPIFGSILPKISNLKGEYFDEYLIGYERELLKNFKLTLKGTYRYLPQTVEDGSLDGPPDYSIWTIGNPGTQNLSFLPKLYRIYKSIEISIENLNYENYFFILSYVLSRNYGNYAGLYEDGAPQPNTSGLPDITAQVPKDEGLLPNDRTHIFKFSGSFAFRFGFTIGTFFLWESGTPLTEFAKVSGYLPTYFASPRGTAGRTPSIWDLNFRFSYDLSNLLNSSIKPKIKLDLFHIFSQRTPVNYDQVHYRGIDQNGQPSDPNPNYLIPITFQPPFTARLGLEINF